ncbi:2OG-Fe(II) oxygenase family protein [Leptospira weilii serovar Ranarum str. ICFT]|uniref:2OG-Fe(II) oxygenase family protein n=1 Tax=Leptospira weilii serovar Ranarum str. ICFT TaxID=1218598 RepID=N1WHD1_9LEPT|nr:2OG-Fe(II) oxygenase [Leptospira weilii]EMY76742.1 2OG-Fe(II) oxygenase family protein [Leptospira weilii serovar Ranarum str. ICFT]
MILHKKPEQSKVPGFWAMPLIKFPIQIDSNFSKVATLIPEIDYWNHFLSPDTCDSLRNLFSESKISAPVSINGLLDQDYGIGSQRATGWSLQLANELSELIIPHLNEKFCSEKTPTDWWQGNPNKFPIWIPVQVSPLFRFMKYESGGEHYAHYDAGFLYEDGIHRTLKSFVIYLTTNQSGATRFIRDNLENFNIWDRNHSDWDRRVLKEEVLSAFLPREGSILIFDHRICHDVDVYLGERDLPRIIIRGDLIYKMKTL